MLADGFNGVGVCGLIRLVSLWTDGERHENEVTPVERQRPAGLPCLSVSASNKPQKKGRSSRFVLLRSTPPFRLCLGFIRPTGGCMQTGAELLWSSVQPSVHLCMQWMSVWANLESVEWRYHSSAGLSDASRPFLTPSLSHISPAEG